MTKLPIKVVRRAAREIADASVWWEANRPEARETFRDEIEQAFELISAYPEIGARARHARLAGVRRIHLSRIHYYLYYRVRPEATEVLALWHTSRGSGPGL